MSTDAYAEDVLGEDVGEDLRTEEHSERNERTEEEKERQFRRRRPMSKNPQIGLDIVTLTEKLILPVEEFPKYNFVGKLLGPKGSTLKNLQQDCKVRMSIMGRGSSKERNKEDELIATGDPQYEHLKEPLHVIISARANKMEAHRRLAAACRELNKFMGPVNEEMYQGQQSDLKADPMNNGRDAGMLPVAAAPKIMFGVPPPGAIILNENPAAFAQARLPRAEERSPPPRESYSYRGYQDSDRGGASRYVEKRNAPDSGSYPLKRYKQDSYGKSQYSSR